MSQNLVLYSQQFSNAVWSGLHAGDTRTDNQVIAPDGTLTGAKINITDVGYCYQLTPIIAVGTSINAIKTFTCSIWLYAATPVTIGLRTIGITTGNGVSNAAVNTVTLTAGWIRYSVQITSKLADDRIYIGLENRVGSGGGGVACTLYAWGAQLVQSNWAGDYIATTTSAIGPTTPPQNSCSTSKLVSEGGQNLLKQSENVALSWTLVNLSSSSVGDTPPTSITTVMRLIETIGAASSRSISQSVTVAYKTSLWTFSVYAKAGSRNWIGVSADAGATVTSFDLTNGVIGSRGTSNTANIVSLGNGWFRCSVTKLMSGIAVTPTVYILSANNTFNYSSPDGAGYVIVGGMQLVQGNQPGEYVPTTTIGIGTTIAPVNLSNASGSNIILYSTTFAAAGGWQFGSNISITNNSIDTQDPFGGNTANCIVELDSISSTHKAYIFPVQPLTTGYFTASVYVKAGTRSQIYLQATASYSLYFDLTTGVFSNVVGCSATSAQDMGNGWWRVSYTYRYNTPTASGGWYIYTISSGAITYAGVINTKALYVYGPQLVLSNQPGEYVLTPTSAINGNMPLLWSSSSVNLLQQSFSLSISPWGTTQSSTAVVANQETNPFTGLQTAIRITDSTTVSQAFHFWGQSFTALPYGVYTFSAIVKANGSQWLDLAVLPGINAYFDIQNGTKGTLTGVGVIDSGITPFVGYAGWYKIYVTAKIAISGCQIYLASNNGTVSYGTTALGYSCFVAAAKLEPGYGGVDWLNTTSSAITSINTYRSVV